MSLAENNNKQLEIKKHVNAIHSSNNISLVQRKLFNAFILNAYHDLPKMSEFRISVQSLSKLIGYDSHDQQKLKNSILSLITTAIEWSILDSENQSKWRASSIISSATIEKGICTYEFSTVMREFLYRPDMYGKIDLNIMSKFKSGYGLALYENCIRFEKISNTPWLSLAVFRKLMGVADGKYLMFCDFKKRVLDIALKEVNDYSNLHVTPEIKRVNKTVVSIRFKLAAKQSQMIDERGSPADELSDTSKILMNEFGLSMESIQELIVQYGHDYVHEKIVLIKSSDNFKSGKIRALAPYFIDALKRDYQKGRSSKAVVSESNKASYDNEKAEKKAHDQQQKQYSQYVSTQIQRYLSSLAENESDHFNKEFEREMSNNPLMYKWYKKHGLQDARIKAIFNDFVKRRSGNALKILGFNEFVSDKSDVCGIT